jgi:hypothetical protein
MRSRAGRIWLSADAGDPLQVPRPWYTAADDVRPSQLPSVARLASAAETRIGYPDAENNVWFLPKPNEINVELGVLNITTAGITT